MKTDPTQKEQQGTALILVLGIILILGFMAAHITLISNLINRESYVVSNRQSLKYTAESATSRALWMLICDRNKKTNRNLGSNNLPTDEENQESWMMDNKPHQLFADQEYPCQITLQDANNGIDCSGTEYNVEKMLKALFQEDTNSETKRSEDEKEKIQQFIDIVKDYIDNTDNASYAYGKETDDYEAEGLPDLPRNAPLQFIQELFWIDNIKEIFSITGIPIHNAENTLQMFRPIPPRGMSFSKNNTRNRTRYRSSTSLRPSFFSCTPILIQKIANLTQEELQEVLTARQQWQTNSTPLSETLDPTIYSKITGKFSFSESSIVTINATAYTNNKDIKRKMQTTCKCTLPNASIGKNTPYIRIWQKRTN